MTELDPRTIWGSAASAENYERGRPGPAPALVAEVCDALGVRPGSRVLDLAAGTGKLTRVLASCADDIVAVEPSAAMRAGLREQVPGVRVRPGTAEAIPLPDASVDAVLVSDAFHWFEPGAALAEMRRVLREGGGAGVFVTLPVWDGSASWVAGLGELLGAHRIALPAANRAEDLAWRAPLGAPPGFAPSQHAEAVVVHSMSRDDIAAQITSWSFVTMLPAGERADFRAALTELLDAPTAGGTRPLELSHRTEAYWMVRAA